MPIVEVSLMGDVAPSVAHGLVQRLTDAVSRVLASAPQDTWVTVHRLSEDDCAENEGRDRTLRPVLARIIRGDLPDGATLAGEAGALTGAIAAACARSTLDVHLIHEPPGAGRVAFGGRLVRTD